MQVFKAFFKIVKYNKLYMVISLGITIALVIMLSGTNADSTKVIKEKYTVIVKDKDNSEISKELVDYIGKIHIIKDGDFSDEMITDLLYYQQIAEYIEIPKGFGDEFEKNGSANIDARYDEAIPKGMFVNNQINEFLSLVNNKIQNGESIKDAASSSAKELDKNEFVSINVKRKGDEEKTKQVFGFMPYAMMLIIFAGCLKPIIAFNEEERKNRIEVSSMKRWKRGTFVALATACLALFFFVVVSGFASVYKLQKIMFTKQWYLIILNLFIYTVSISMLLFAISTFIKKDGSHTNMISNIFTLSFAFLGGSFVPLEYLGKTVKMIGRFVPNYWYSTALNDIVAGKGMSTLMGSFIIQIAFGVAALAIGLCSIKIRNQRGIA